MLREGYPFELIWQHFAQTSGLVPRLYDFEYLYHRMRAWEPDLNSDLIDVFLDFFRTRITVWI